MRLLGVARANGPETSPRLNSGGLNLQGTNTINCERADVASNSCVRAEVLRSDMNKPSRPNVLETQ